MINLENLQKEILKIDLPNLHVEFEDETLFIDSTNSYGDLVVTYLIGLDDNLEVVVETININNSSPLTVEDINVDNFHLSEFGSKMNRGILTIQTRNVVKWVNRTSETIKREVNYIIEALEK